MVYVTCAFMVLASLCVGSCDQRGLRNKNEDNIVTKVEGDKPQEDKEDRAALFSQPSLFPVPVINPLGLHHQVPQLPLQVIPQFSPGIGDRLLGALGGSNPECTTSGPFCLYDDAYPRDKISLIVNRYYEDVRNMYASLHRIPFNDLLHHDNTTHRFREGGHFICESQVQYIRPGWARNIRGDWMAIINTDRFPQVVRVEECKYASRRCEYLPPCYKSTCIQRFSLEKLLSVDPRSSSDKPIVDVFEIPTACSCFVDNFAYY